METLKIEIPQGHEVESFDKSSGVIKFREKPKSVTERIKDFKDVLKENSISQVEWAKMCKDLEDDEVYYKAVKLICKSLNEGWEPDWSDSDEYKYIPWFEMAGSSGFRYDGYDNWSTHSYVGSRLCYKSSELAEYAGNQFQEEYENFMLIKK